MGRPYFALSPFLFLQHLEARTLTKNFINLPFPRLTTCINVELVLFTKRCEFETIDLPTLSREIKSTFLSSEQLLYFPERKKYTCKDKTGTRKRPLLDRSTSSKPEIPFKKMLPKLFRDKLSFIYHLTSLSCTDLLSDILDTAACWQVPLSTNSQTTFLDFSSARLL